MSQAPASHSWVTVHFLQWYSVIRKKKVWKIVVVFFSVFIYLFFPQAKCHQFQSYLRDISTANISKLTLNHTGRIYCTAGKKRNLFFDLGVSCPFNIFLDYHRRDSWGKTKEKVKPKQSTVHIMLRSVWISAPKFMATHPITVKRCH